MKLIGLLILTFLAAFSASARSYDVSPEQVQDCREIAQGELFELCLEVAEDMNRDERAKQMAFERQRAEFERQRQVADMNAFVAVLSNSAQMAGSNYERANPNMLQWHAEQSAANDQRYNDNLFALKQLEQQPTCGNGQCTLRYDRLGRNYCTCLGRQGRAVLSCCGR